MSAFVKNFLNEWPFKVAGVKVDMSDVSAADKRQYLWVIGGVFAALSLVAVPFSLVLLAVTARKWQMALSKKD